jgi:zinc protease
VTLADPRAEQPNLRRLYLVPSAVTAAAGESEALEVLAQLMGGGINAYLFRALAVDQKIAVSANAWYQGTALDPTQFGIAASPKPGVSFETIEEAIDKVIAGVKQAPVPAEDLESAKTQLIAESVYARDSQSTMARWYGAAITVGLTVADIQSWPDRIRAVTAAQVSDAARKWLDKKRSSTGYLIKEAPSREEKRS